MLRFVTALTVAACARRPGGSAGAALVPAERAARRDRHRRRARDPAQRRPARLAPGARIRDANNMAVVPSGLDRRRAYLVNYTVDTSGLVKEVWILRPEEAAVRPWPTTPAEARRLDLRSRRPGLDQAVSAAAVGRSQAGLHQDLRLPDERLRLRQDGRRAARGGRLRADRQRRRRRPDPVQHLLGAREGAGEGVQRPRPRQAPEGARHADRRRRLRREPGRRGDRRARALRRPRLRPADAAPPAGDAGAPAQPKAGPRSTSAFPRSRSSTTCRRRGSTGRRRSSRSWKAARSTARTASSRTRAARKSRVRSTTCWSRSPASPTRAFAR